MVRSMTHSSPSPTRNAFMSSSLSSNYKKSNTQNSNNPPQSEEELLSMSHNLHMKILDQLIDDQKHIIHPVFMIEMIEKSQIRKTLLLSSHLEANRIRLEKEQIFNAISEELQYFKHAAQEELQRKKEKINRKLEIKKHSRPASTSFNSYSNSRSRTPNENMASILPSRLGSAKSQFFSYDKDMWKLYQREQELDTFSQELLRVKSHLERIKWCLNEQTNVYAYKLSIIKDVSHTKMDEKVEQILTRYKQVWPYLPLSAFSELQTFDPSKLSNIFKRRLGSFSSSTEETAKLLNMDILKSSIASSKDGKPQHRVTNDDNENKVSSEQIKALIEERDAQEKKLRPIKLFQETFTKHL